MGQIQYSEKYFDDTYEYRLSMVLCVRVALLCSSCCRDLREKWTEEEHQRFLEALRLYGRGWRQIEEHVGTKSADQIRSHAQKFFSKVVRESNGGFDGSIKPVVIPPPRLKRKQVIFYSGIYGKALLEVIFYSGVCRKSAAKGHVL
ncbi:hypothetical protein PVK06_027017 [Gossypium arboreum]|uniref:Protein REVEILLE 2-like n=1 Tax=Gossypium arboreum TaxID=29729 RepID=A0ABR0P1Q6_GOSAR|nr:hypothetical protein PVK06_027017 [Gossypium arboreum]